MLELAGYKVGDIAYNSSRTTICHGVRNSDNKKVLIKFHNNEHPTIEDLISIKREYMIASKNYGDNVIKVYEAINCKNSIAIVFEDFGAQSLAELLKTKKLDLKKKLFVAVNIAEALVQVHKQGVVHKDINPFNIVWNFETDEIKLIDFGISSELMDKGHINPNKFEGTCLYVSPEQTGKINRIVDFRSDLYSAGVTFYEIFTGKPPFEGDELEIIYSHIAKMPLEPKFVCNEIPSTISDIIMKLLSKNAEDRYKTASGLKSDLQYCLENIYSSGKINNFLIAQKDVSNRFEIPQKLYGRENDLIKIKNLLNGSIENHIRMLIVSGYPGVGKTAIIEEVSQEFFCKGSRFISGRFSQFERNNPYSAVKTAFGTLIKNLLLENNKLDFWRCCLEKALGTNAGILAEIIPELELIIGKQPEIGKIEPIEENARIKSVLISFIKVFTDKDNRLILFLDDLQWSDLSSINLLKYLLSSDEIENFIVIGLYRDNEVKDDHPLLSMLNEVKENSDIADLVYNYHLEPLQESAVNQLIAETLNSDPNDTLILTNYIYQKTKGNPFFTYQLLKTLYENGLFWFDEDNSNWQWRIEDIKNVQISDNVADFLIQNLLLLPSKTLNILKLASCVGNYFDLKIIWEICDDRIGFSDALQTAIKKEYIISVDNNHRFLNFEEENCLNSNIRMVFRFNHSRIQQSLYSLVSDKEKEIIHYRIGKVLLRPYDDRIIYGSKLFEITNHLNLGKNIITDKEERLQLLDLNFKAGQKAKRNLAYVIAKNYYATGLKVLSDDDWREFPEKLFELSLKHVEACYLSGDIDNILSLCDNTLELATCNIERAMVYELKAKILDHTGEDREIIVDEIKKGLILLGMDLPADPKEIDSQVVAGIAKMQSYLANNSIEELVNLPEIKDENLIMVIKLLFQLTPIAFEFYPPLYTLIKLKMFDAAINFGTTEVLCKNFAECGMILGPVLGDYDSAYKFNILAFSLIDRFKSDRLKSSTFFIYATFISHWKKHFSEGLKYYDLSINYGMKTGDILHAFWSTYYKLDHLFSTGINLDDYKLKLDKAEELIISHKTTLFIPILMMMKHVVNQFQSAYNLACENSILESISKTNNMTAAFKFGQFNVMINYILGNYEIAQKWVEYTERYLQAATGLFGTADYLMFSSLCYIKKFEKQSEDKNNLLEKINTNLKSLKVWSENCPENFGHKYYIVAAELARIQNNTLENITDLYKKSLDSIAPAEFINIKAVINEIIAEFWFSRSEKTIGNTFIKEAIYFYNLWGAYIKADSLESKYSNFSNEINHLNSLSRKRLTGEAYITKKTSNHSSTLNLDIMSILKSTQAISNEIKVDKLLKVLMDVIIENTGAQKGCVLFKNVNDGEFYVEAVKKDGADDIIITDSLALSESSEFCTEIVQYVIRTHEIIVVSNAMKNSFYKNYDYIKRMCAKSILCVPIIYQNDLNGIIYLENNLVENAFDCQRIEIIQILSSQIAISVEKAQLYEKMEEKVYERTRQLALANYKLKELSLHDPLTKLYNRRYVYEHINNLSDNFTKAKLKAFFNSQYRDMNIKNNVIGIYLLDIDHFKQVNDTYGHAAGDEVLIQLSNVLKNLVRSVDFVVRWGGEEFLILLNETKIEYLEIFSEKVLNKIEKTGIELPNKTIINKTCSIGCAYLPFEMRYSDLLTFEQTVNICDFGLYLAKEHGRNCSVHVSLAKSVYENDRELKQYLTGLSKDSPVDNDFIKVKYIRPKKQD